MYDLSGLNAAYAGTWDASIGRNDPPVFERNPAPSTSLYSTAGFGFVDGISKDLLLGPPTLVRALGLRTIGRGPFKGEPVWRTSTFAIDRGRITG